MRARPTRFGLWLVVSIVAHSAHADTPQECIALWGGLVKTNHTQGIVQQDFMAACLAHRVVATQPGISAAPPNATARCQDGTYTAAEAPLAGCNHHGGVAVLTHP